MGGGSVVHGMFFVELKFLSPASSEPPRMMRRVMEWLSQCVAPGTYTKKSYKHMNCLFSSAGSEAMYTANSSRYMMDFPPSMTPIAFAHWWQSRLLSPASKHLF